MPLGRTGTLCGAIAFAITSLRQFQRVQSLTANGSWPMLGGLLVLISKAAEVELLPLDNNDHGSYG
jgi:hypothetical protein